MRSEVARDAAAFAAPRRPAGGRHLKLFTSAIEQTLICGIDQWRIRYKHSQDSDVVGADYTILLVACSQ